MSPVIEISDLHDPALQIYSNLTKGDPNKTNSVFLAESEKVIRYALKAGCRPVSFLMERQDLDALSPLVAPLGVPVYTGSREQIRTLTGYVLNRGFLCAMERPRMPKQSSVLCSTSRIAVLRNITDPTDLGAVFRSAAALGIDGILIGEGCCDPLYRRAVRVSMGTVFQVPWTYLRNPIPEDFQVITISASPTGIPIDAAFWRSAEKLVIILDPKAGADAYTIGQRPDTEELNLSAASAVLFWMLRK